MIVWMSRHMIIGDSIIVFLLQNAQYDEARFQEDTLKHLGASALQYLFDSGLLVKTGELASHVYEYGEPVKVQVVRSNPPRYFIFDGDELIPVPVSRLELYTIDYGVLARIVQRDFATKNGITNPIPGKLWMCGNHGSQQREVYLARNAGNDANISAYLNGQYTRGIVLQIGIPCDSLTEHFHESQVCHINEIIAWKDEKLTLDSKVIKDRIKAAKGQDEEVKHRMGKKYQEYKGLIKVILRDTFLFYLANARRCMRGEPPVSMPPSPPRTRRKERRFENFDSQKTLSICTNIPETTISDIKSEWANYPDVDNNRLYTALMDLLTSKRKNDPEEIFQFYATWKEKLIEEGFKDPG